MNSPQHAQAKTLTRQDVMDLVQTGLILAMTVAAAMIVPPKVFGAVRAAAVSLEQPHAK